MSKIFVPHELKTIEIDAEKKIFRINGEDFGKDCDGFTITCRRYNDFDLRVEVGTTIRFVTYGENGQVVKDKQFSTHDPWFSPAEIK